MICFVFRYCVQATYADDAVVQYYWQRRSHEANDDAAADANATGRHDDVKSYRRKVIHR